VVDVRNKSDCVKVKSIERSQSIKLHYSVSNRAWKTWKTLPAGTCIIRDRSNNYVFCPSLKSQEGLDYSFPDYTDMKGGPETCPGW
jgi:hypothetical protein